MRAVTATAVLVLVLTAGVCPAEAQFGSAPYRGLFGGAQSGGRDHSLDLTVSGFASYITDVLEDSQPAGESGRPGTWSRGATASLYYSRNWRSASLGAFASGGASYFDSIEDDPWIERWQAGVLGSFTRPIARRWDFAANTAAIYSPHYGFGSGVGGIGTGGLDGGWGIGPDRIDRIPGLDYAVTNQPLVRTDTQASLRRGVSRRSSIDLIYGLQTVNIFESDEMAAPHLNQIAHRVMGRYRFQINRFLSARAGYGYRRASYGDSDRPPIGSHDLDVGLDGGYGREIELGRRTSFSFDTRSSIFVYENLRDGEAEGTRTSLFLGGSAALRHRWGRSWQAQLRYDRTASFVDGFTEPFLSNMASALVRGLPLRRLDVSAYATYSVGEVGLTGAERGFTTATGLAQVRTAITRNLAAYAQYFYYHYDFERGAAVPSLFARNLDRQGGAVGLTYWLPLL